MSVSTEALQKQVSYWKEALAGAPTRLEFPTDKPRPASRTLRAERQFFDLPRKLLARLESVGAPEQATPFMTLGAAFVALLHRYTNQDDVLLGVPGIERAFTQTGNPFDRSVNSTVLRMRFAEGLTFRYLLQQFRDQAQGAYANSDLPFEQLVSDMAIEQDPSHSPLFQVMFAFNHALKTSDFPAHNGNGSGKHETLYDLTLALSETADGIKGCLEYRADLFEAETIRRLCEHYSILLEAVANSLDQGIASLPLLSDAERNQILCEWNSTRADFPQVCVHQLFEQQATRNPDAVAVTFKAQQLTYRELNERANQVGRYLRKRGVGPEVLVGVCMERCPDLLIALLGVWKAGGAYIPLDPSYPKERLSFSVKNSSAKIAITDAEHAGLISSAANELICMDSQWPAIAQENSNNLEPTANLSNLAYVMYTSGSTGEPKGVMVLHRGLVNYLSWAVKTYAVAPGGSVPVHTSIAFDLTVTALYTPLLAGARVEILQEDVGGQNLVSALRKGGSRSLVKITPAHLELLSQQITPNEAAGRTKVFVIGGENLVAESLSMWRKSAPATRLINEYGPTETVVGCCVYEVKPDDPASGSVPIGRPIANTQLYILDRQLNPVPIGVIGELYIGGAGVARGYLNRPDLSSERFIADPFSGEISGEAEARLYKTGDMARYRKDGVLEYLGRADDQVKVRGYRIELGEIEATLAKHPKVKSCSVLAREDEPGNKQLVGYVVPSGEQPNPEDIRRFLAQSLPDYMVPAQFVFLGSMPLTQNGKVDRKALPAPSHATASESRESVAPRNKTEETLATIWMGLLKVEGIGIHDDLFELGAHSLMALRAVSQIREIFGVDLPLATLLEAPTIAGLAAILHKEHWEPSWSSLVAMRTGGSKQPLFLMHAHGGNVLEYRAMVGHMDPEQPVYAFQARGLDGAIVKDNSLEQMASAYVTELRQFQPMGPYFLGGFCLGGLLALEMAQQLTAAGQEVALVIMIQSMHPEAMRFKPEVTAIERWWYRAAARVNLEWESFSNRGSRYILERALHAWDVARARMALAFDKVIGNGHRAQARQPKLYVFESIGTEHKRAMQRYVPRAYNGDVLLLRASKQISGRNLDEYLGWKRVLHGRLYVREVPGYQQTLMIEPNVSQLAKEFDLRLKEAQERNQEEARQRTSASEKNRRNARGSMFPISM